MDRDTNPIIPQHGVPPLVSVMVLAYNHGPYIEECLESLACQVVNFPYEIVVGEDCSTDDTRKRVASMVEKYPGRIIPLYHNTNCGMHANVEAVAQRCCGKYLAFCEGDDFWQRRDKLQLQVDCLENAPDVSLVCSDLDIFFQRTGEVIRNADRHCKGWQQPLHDATTSLFLREIGIGTCTAVIRTSDFIRVRKENPFEFSLQWPMQDFQLFIEISRLGRVVHLSESLATYRVLDESASNTRSALKLFDFNVKVFNLSEHYARKLLINDEIVNKVRRYYFSEGYRFSVDMPPGKGFAAFRSFVDACPIRPETLSDYLKIRAVGSPGAWWGGQKYFFFFSHLMGSLRGLKMALHRTLLKMRSAFHMLS